MKEEHNQEQNSTDSSSNDGEVNDQSYLLQFKSNSQNIPDTMLLDGFASILIEIIIDQIKNEQHSNKSSNILPGINKGAS